LVAFQETTEHRLKYISLLYYVIFGIFVAVIVGGMDMVSQAMALAKKPHVIIGEYLDRLYCWEFVSHTLTVSVVH